MGARVERVDRRRTAWARAAARCLQFLVGANRPPHDAPERVEAAAVQVRGVGALRPAARRRVRARRAPATRCRPLPGRVARLDVAEVDERPGHLRPGAALAPQQAGRRVHRHSGADVRRCVGDGARDEQLLDGLARGGPRLHAGEGVDRRRLEALGPVRAKPSIGMPLETSDRIADHSGADVSSESLPSLGELSELPIQTPGDEGRQVLVLRRREVAVGVDVLVVARRARLVGGRSALAP